MAQILKLKSRTETIDVADTLTLCALLHRELRVCHGRFATIAREANVHPNTVAKIAYGDTKSPTARTALAIIRALGWKIYATR